MHSEKVSMTRAPSSRRNHLRLVEAPPINEIVPALADPTRRAQIEQLTGELVDVLIEMIDLSDGDENLEIDDPAEDSDDV